MKKPLVFLFSLLSTVSLFAGDKLVNVQGKLTDAAGNPLTGSRTVTFRLYDVSTAPVASALWSDTLTVSLSSGLFNVPLGSNTSLDALPFNKTYYLGMQVAGDASEMSPRQTLAASPYALGSVGDFQVGKNALITGNVGIGTTSPSKALEIRKEALISGNDASGTEYSDWPNSSLSIRRSDNFVANGVTMMSFGYRGDPTYFTDDSVANIRLWDTSQSANAALSAATTQLRIGAPGPLVLQPSGGRVGVGTSNPAYAFSVAGSTYLVAGLYGTHALGTLLRLENSNATTSWNVAVSGTGWYGPANAGDFVIDKANFGPQVVLKPNGNMGLGTLTPVVKLDVAGAVQASAVYETSDKNLKKNIQGLPPDTLNRALLLNGVSYQWDVEALKKKYGKTSVSPGGTTASANLVGEDSGVSISTDVQIGLIAQDVEGQFPSLVHTGADGFKAVDYGKFSAVLLEAVKAQQQLILQLRRDLDDLKAKVK